MSGADYLQTSFLMAEAISSASDSSASITARASKRL